MTNDLTTLNGSLQEVIDRLETNLAAKGVNASYSSSTGILGLVDQIQNISQSGGSGSGVPCYHVEFADGTLDYFDYDFANDVYKAFIEVYLQYQYAPYAGTVTLSDGTNSYTITTGADGKGTLSPSVTNNATTFTASYTNTSDTITIPKTTFHHLDKCNSADGLSGYGSSVIIYESSNPSSHPSCGISYNSSKNAYDVHSTTTGTTSYYSMIPITALDGKTDYVVDMWVTQNKSYSANEIGLFVRDSQDNSVRGQGITMNTYYNRFYLKSLALTSSSTTTVNISEGTLAVGTWYHMRLKIEDGKTQGWLFDSNGNEWGYVSNSSAIANKQLGIIQRGGTVANTTNYIKEIKIRSIATS